MNDCEMDFKFFIKEDKKMTINGINGANSRAGVMGMNQETDPYIRNIQNQITNEQKRLQELSSNEDLTMEEKMKKRQEIQQKISDLNVQLRQYQAEQRREKQQEKSASMDDLSGGTENSESTKMGSKNTGLSQTSMTAMISADSSIKQAKIQGSVAANLEGKANVLKSEIINSHGRSLEKKKEELADIEQKAQSATVSQMSTLGDAVKTVKEASQEENKDTKTQNAKEKDSEETVSDTDAKEENVSGSKDVSVPESTSVTEETVTPKPTVYKSVDIRL